MLLCRTGLTSVSGDGDAFTMPARHGWRWDGDWIVDDAEPEWEHSKDWRLEFHREMRITDLVRRRRIKRRVRKNNNNNIIIVFSCLFALQRVRIRDEILWAEESMSTAASDDGDVAEKVTTV